MAGDIIERHYNITMGSQARDASEGKRRGALRWNFAAERVWITITKHNCEQNFETVLHRYCGVLMQVTYFKTLKKNI